MVYKTAEEKERKKGRSKNYRIVMMIKNLKENKT